MSSEDIGQASSTGEKIVLIVDDDRDIGDKDSTYSLLSS